MGYLALLAIIAAVLALIWMFVAPIIHTVMGVL